MVAGALLASTVILAVAPGSAAPRVDPPTAAVDEDLGTDPVLDDIRVDADAGTRAAKDRYDAARTAQRAAIEAQRAAERERDHLTDDAGQANRAQDRAQADLDAARAKQADEEVELTRRQDVEAAAGSAFVAERRDLRRLAAAVVTASTSDRYAIFSAGDDASRYERRDAVKVRSIDQQTARLEARREPWLAAQRSRRQEDLTVAGAKVATAEAKDRLDAATRTRLDLERRAADAGAEATRRQAAVEQAAERTKAAAKGRRAARLTARVTGLDLPLVAVDAYWRAAGNAPCPTPWWLLAGVSRTESDHGTAQGSSLDATGTTTKRILGIALDGGPGVAAIRDSDGGLLDSDVVWDRAVGPMQFIPSTWGRWAADDNGDGVADPHNLYDAAGAAANYLCFGRPELTDEASQVSALLSYNQSLPYGAQVLASGHAYRAALAIPDAAPRSVPPAR